MITYQMHKMGKLLDLTSLPDDDWTIQRKLFDFCRYVPKQIKCEVAMKNSTPRNNFIGDTVVYKL